jgi:hypothetical protein
MVRKSKSMYFPKSTKGNRNLDIYKCPKTKIAKGLKNKKTMVFKE